MPGPVFLEGDRVDFHPIDKEDIDFIQRLVNDPEVRKGMSLAAPISEMEEREWVESVGEDDDIHMIVGVDGEPVGTFTFMRIVDIWGSAEVAYMIAPEQWGNGYATDALKRACQYAFEERRLRKLTARAFETNPASQRVLEKAGFVEEGRFRSEAYIDGERIDVFRYGLLAAEWG